MTAHQAQLIDAEISRHISLALISEERVIRRDHLEVAKALTAVLVAEERRAGKCRSRTSGIRIGLFHPPLLAKLRGVILKGKEKSPGL